MEGLIASSQSRRSALFHFMDVNEQIKNWEILYDRIISEEEYKEICQNLSGFFTTLKQWSDDDERMLKENGQNNDKPSEFLPSAAE